MEGRIGMTECGTDGQCDRESQCGVRGSWRQINHILDNALRGVSLADMLQPPAPPALATIAISEIKGRTTA
jgi:DNA-binding IscR family transcriptional regulator